MSVTNFSQPYKLINDEKLKIKSSKVERVLDGELDILLEATSEASQPQ